MNLSTTELGWLAWFGKTGKIAMGCACFLNRNHYSSVEKTFEAIATTRSRILMHGSNTQWEHLANLADITKMKHSVDALNKSGDQVKITAGKLHKLTGQFQVSASA
jgi:hypothetical protein